MYSIQHIELLAGHLQMMFERMARVDENYFLCDMGEQKVRVLTALPTPPVPGHPPTPPTPPSPAQLTLSIMSLLSVGVL